LVPGRTFCRLTVLAPRTRVDVALPVDVPVAELVPMLLELVGEPRGAGWRPVPWRLTGAAGGALPTGATLDELAVPDGELLRLAPATPPPPAPVFDDPVDAIADSAGDGHPLGGRFGAGALLALAMAAAGVFALPGPGSTGSAVVAGLAAGAALWAAAWLTRRPAPGPAPGPAPAGTAALVAVPLAAAAGWTALPPMAEGGQLASLLLAVAAAGVVATIGQVLVRVVAPALIAVLVAAVLLGCALIAMRLGVAPGAATAAGAALALVIGPLLPRAAIRLSGLPRPVVPGDPEPPDGGLPHAELAERVALARGYLGGLTAGCAAGTAVGAVAAAALDTAMGGWVGAAFAGTAVAALGLRSRGYADPVPARATLAAAVLGATGLAVVLGPTGAGVWAGLVLVATCAIGLLTTARVTAPISPVTRRLVDVVEGGLVVAAVPLALGAMGVYRIVRGL
jgi:type VII secretion integral membrane protein EccD